MSGVRSDIDLGALSRPEPQVKPPRRRRMLLVPILVVVAFLALLISSLGNFLRKAQEITVVRPKSSESAGSEGVESGAALFQAAGWAEPDPFPILVTALASGVVREILVLEAGSVSSGQPVARLVEDDARIALAAAEAELERSQAEQSQANVEAAIAEESFHLGLVVQEAEESARAEAEGRHAAARFRDAALAQGQAQLRIAEEELAVQRVLAEEQAAGPRQVELAEAKRKAAEGALEMLRAEAAMAAAEARKADAVLHRSTVERERRLEDRRLLEGARAQRSRAQASVNSASAGVEAARLRLNRMTVISPVDGIVLERLVGPGAVLQTESSGAPILALYDPSSLRIRVDVPVQELSKVSVGQKSEILTEARSGAAYHGEVVRIVHKADIQKVTVQVHVRVDDEDSMLRPELLCQVRFLSVGGAPGESTGAATRVLVPARLLVSDSSLWIVDGVNGTAHLSKVKLGQRMGDWVEVLTGINLSDKLIDEGRDRVREGSRVRILTEDPNHGVP